MEENDQKEFIVRDRRISSSKDSGDSSEPSGEQSEHAPSNAERATGSSSEQKQTEPIPDLDFSAFILTLAATAQVSLGSLPNPQTRQSEQDLPAAKQMIDILGLLKDKTKGNLSQDEQALLDSALFNLRMQYIEAIDGKK
ncbi:MAG TPA: DUF1844 domain-containing protein [Nitrospirota bacterium]|nr:DUF1844 domain-containing protein [Nitrospirota bacterium]